MASKTTAATEDEEENRVHRPDEGEVNKVHRLPASAKESRAKATLGRAIAAGIGDRPTKEFGSKSLISGLISGEKVPDYLAGIVADPAARRRFAKALLDGDKKVKRQTVYVIDEDEAVGE